MNTHFVFPIFFLFAQITPLLWKNSNGIHLQTLKLFLFLSQNSEHKCMYSDQGCLERNLHVQNFSMKSRDFSRISRISTKFNNFKDYVKDVATVSVAFCSVYILLAQYKYGAFNNTLDFQANSNIFHKICNKNVYKVKTQQS